MSDDADLPAPQKRHLWIDATAGVSGDMLLGALVDLGADLRAVQAAVDTVIPATVTLEAATVSRAGLRALKVDVRVLRGEQPHRTWQDVRSLLTNAPLSDGVRRSALSVFQLLAEAEARVHGKHPDDVHFHEVGAWDSIADIVGVAAAVEQLKADAVTASPVALGSGRVRTSHGDLPVPAPATVELSIGWTVRSGGEGELSTPTGMALVRTLAREVCELPRMSLEAVGVGAGSRDTPGRPNVVRVLIGREEVRPESQHSGHSGHSGDLDGAASSETLFVLEANVDDLDPRVWPEVLATLMGAGAADAWLSPILMKKGRPAHTLSALCAASAREHLRELMFLHTTTLGVREHPVTRTGLDRDWHTVRVRGVDVRVKVSTDVDGNVVHATPEFDDALMAAHAHGIPVRQMLDEITATAANAGLAPSHD